MNPISAMLLVREDRHVFETIKCLRPHVAELVVGHTGCPELTPDELRPHVDVYVNIPPAGDGRIMNWARARNLVLDKCTQRYLMWADSDDTVRGLEYLPSVLRELDARPRSRVLAPYEYLKDAKGRVTHRQYRERIVVHHGGWHWDRPCHEVLVADDGVYDKPEIRTESIVWEHHRVDQPEENGRQLAMLRAYEAEGHGDDPWLLLNLGLDLARHGQKAEAVAYLTRYLAASEWEDERAWVMCQLARIATTLDIAKGLDDTAAWTWAMEAADLRPDWFEPEFELARLTMMRATFGGGEADLDQCVAHCAAARQKPPSDHPLATIVEDRDYRVHDLERSACETLQDWRGALDACNRILETRPDEATVRMAKMRYEAAIRLENAEKLASAGTLAEISELPAAAIAESNLAAMRAGILRTLGGEPLDIIFACGQSWSEWNPAVLAERGLGGSETAVVEMAKRLSAKGHRVRVYCNCGGPGIYDGVEYRESTSITERPTCDVLIAWRMAPLLDFADAKARLLWVHDVEAAQMGPRYQVRADRVLALSEWHRGNLIEKHGLHPEQVVKTRNGIDLSRFAIDTSTRIGATVTKHFDGRPPEIAVRDETQRYPQRDHHRCIYSSSADRGLQVLLDVWPEIRARVPDASLDVYYQIDTWREVAERSGSQQQRYSVISLERRLRNTPGVTYHGGVNQRELARAMLGAGVWVGSLWFPETSCIGAMEAQAAGLRCIGGANAALPETIGDRGSLLPGDWLDERYQRLLSDEIVRAMLLSEGQWVKTRAELQQYARNNFSWDSVAEEWLLLFGEVLEDVGRGAMPAYGWRESA